MATRKTSTEEELLAHLRKTVEDAEELLNQASKAGNEKADELRSRAKQLLNSVQEGFEEKKEEVVERTKEAVNATNTYVYDNPWRAVGAVSIAALLLGIIIGRK
ncbi:YqjD family protein [Pelistega sp. MC2]|uniref:DUF883 family protein n=1 Tax=Pelistega sp. MC2 TaxID=1720297 RepID=UPI0008DA127D|nr:DUF883 family protein [Pelistega sp. MC2]